MLALLLFAGAGYAAWQGGAFTQPVKEETVATTTPLAATTTKETTQPTASHKFYKYGTITLSLNQAAGFQSGTSIRPLRVTEDSRCPVDVTCIQAGTAKIMLRVNNGSSALERELELGSSTTVGKDTITFTELTPLPKASIETSSADYRMVFKISNASVAGGTQCFVGGCSRQLCTDTPDAVSTCEYRAEYACYQSATCERQASGQCGWTPSGTLSACLANPPQ